MIAPIPLRRSISVFLFIATAGVLSGTRAEAALTLSPVTQGRVTLAGAVGENNPELLVGDSSTNGTVFTSIFNFSLSSSTAEIAAASQITFTINPTAQNDVGPDIRLIALNGDGSVVDMLDANAVGVTVATFTRAEVASALTLGQALTFDVTEFVKADALAGTFTTFRLESVSGTSNNDGNSDAFVFGRQDSSTAALNIIPEPASAVLLLGAAGVLLRRRRK